MLFRTNTFLGFINFYKIKSNFKQFTYAHTNMETGELWIFFKKNYKPKKAQKNLMFTKDRGVICLILFLKQPDLFETEYKTSNGYSSYSLLNLELFEDPEGLYLVLHSVELWSETSKWLMNYFPAIYTEMRWFRKKLHAEYKYSAGICIDMIPRLQDFLCILCILC